MNTHGTVQVPPGVQCFVGEQARRRRQIEDRVLSVFEGWDYEEIIPPLFDYAEVFGSSALARKTYTFVGRDGSLLALRPDFTSLLAKIAAGRLAHREPPIRLYYSGEVLRYEPPKAGRQSELHQMGLEHLGGAGPAADAEVIAVAAECMEAAGASDFVLALGHVGAFWGLVRPLGLDETALDDLRARVENKDAEGVRDLLRGLRVEPQTIEALVRLATLAGDVAQLEEASRALAFSPEASAAVAELRAVIRALAEAGLGARIDLDLGEVRGLDYYTGLVFQVYAPGLGFEVGGGGRYDGLLARFGRPMPAVGFMIGLDRLALLLERQGALSDAAAPPAVWVREPTIGGSLALARRNRAEGRRVRLGNGGAE
jgi:ATP phosphoribosyltransferase regulatory subunit